MRKKFTLGIHFDVYSGRAVLLDISNGELVSSKVFEYPKKAGINQLPDGTSLGENCCLGHPSNYLYAIKSLISELLKDANVYPSQVIALGINFDSYTIISADNEEPENIVGDSFLVEAPDWITMELTGELVSSSIYPLGEKIGELNQMTSMNTGLLVGTCLAVPASNAHVTLPALGVTEAGEMVILLERSIRQFILSKEKKELPGLCSLIEDRLIPGYFTYETMQPEAGEIFDSFLEQFVNKEYHEAAENEGIDLLTYLIKKAELLRPGESGLLVLDWWSGNKSILDNKDLSGLIIGLGLKTKPEAIFRALMEAVAFGTLKIIKNFREYGIPVEKLYLCGELVEKNPLLMQIFSDVCNMEIYTSAFSHPTAVGSAIMASVAAGKALGGYDNVFEAAKKISKLNDTVYRPIAENVEIYKELFIEYEKLYNYFGHNENTIMKRLKEIKER